MALIDNKKLYTFLLGIAIIVLSKISSAIIGTSLSVVGWLIIMWSISMQYNSSFKFNFKTILTLIAIALIVSPDYTNNTKETKTKNWCKAICQTSRIIGWILLVHLISSKGNSVLPKLSNFNNSKGLLTLIAFSLVLTKLFAPVTECTKNIILVNILWLLALANSMPSSPSSSVSVALNSI